MKLIYCPTCNDVKRLKFGKTLCDCGASWGWCRGPLLTAPPVEFGGDAIPLGIDGVGFERALMRSQETKGKQSEPFIAFVIEADCPTFKKAPPPPTRRPEDETKDAETK